MKQHTRLGLLVLAAILGIPGRVTVAATPTAAVVADKWVAEEEDNICGISDLKKVSNPAKVDYDALWEATPQIKKMKEKKIDPESTEGKALRNGAKTLITKSAQLVQEAKAYCGVWKAISNEDGRDVPDITKAVKAKFEE
jgi:hypothetical protein